MSYKRLTPTCIGQGCQDVPAARGMCKTHWARWRKHGDCELGAKVRLPAKCEAVGCGLMPRSRLQDGKAYCNKHYLRMWSNGSEERRRPIPKNPDRLIGWHKKRFLKDPLKEHISCAVCAIDMWLPLSKVEKYKTCGAGKCKADYETRHEIIKDCSVCGKPFKARIAQILIGGAKFCSHKCHGTVTWKGGRAGTYQRRVVEMSEDYIKNIMGMAGKLVPDELIKFKREHLRLVRLLKEKTS